MKITDVQNAEIVLLIDLSNLAYICGYAKHYAEMRTTTGIKSGIMYGLNQKLYSIIRAIGGKSISLIFALDNNPQYKYDLYPEFKGERDKDRYNPKPEAKSFISNVKCFTVESDGFEADDVMATFSKKFIKQYPNKILHVLTVDKDVWHILHLNHKNLKIYNHITKVFIRELDLIKKFHGIDSWKKIGLFKALFSDNNHDNIKPALPNVAKKRILPIIDNCICNGDYNETVESFYSEFNKIKDTFTKITTDKIINGREKLILNLKLTKLHYDLKLKYNKYDGNANGLIDIFNKYQCYDAISNANFFAGQIF